tara:strand:- start:89 stop:256 length:168 start_codon:yes stop_codon:yes gene_type:complete
MKDKREQVTEEVAEQAQIVQIPLNIINEALQYLATRPFNEVAGIISDIQQNSKTI